jgi:hypothetical protein
MTIGDKPTIHAVFNMSAAESIRQAFSQIGRHELVLGFPDNLSFGPIDPPSARLRHVWIENELGVDFEEVVQTADRFWAETASSAALPVAWMSTLDAAEYCGFLEFVRRRGDAPFRVVIFTGFEYAGNGETIIAAASLGLVPPDQIVEARLFDHEKELRPDEIEAFLEMWRRLRQENAPLRVVDGTGLVSAPITHFDDAIVSCASGDWQKGTSLVATTMSQLSARPLDRAPSDLLLWARVRALGEAGILETTGDGIEMWSTLVRRSQEPSR